MAQKGLEHEHEYLAQLKSEGGEVAEVPSPRAVGWPAAVRATAEAMRAGADVIYQAALVGAGWRGIGTSSNASSESPDSARGAMKQSTQSSLAAKHFHITCSQLCFYTTAVADVQGRHPDALHVVLGSGERATIAPREVAAYYRHARTRFEHFAAAEPSTVPYPVDQCTYCDFIGRCRAHWQAADHLSAVAGIRRDQVERLEAGGVRTLEQLATLPTSASLRGLRSEPLEALREQAGLQFEARFTPGTVPFRLRPLEPQRGFARLPRPSPGDVVLDFEADPFWTPARDLTFLTRAALCRG